MTETLLILLTLGVWCLLITALVAWQINRERTILMKLSELSDKLDPIVTAIGDVGTQLEKAKTEIIAALSDVEIPAAAAAKIEQLGTLGTQLKTVAQALDDLNTDAPAPA